MMNTSIMASLEFAELWYAKRLSDPENLCDWRSALNDTYTTSCGHFYSKLNSSDNNGIVLRYNLAGDCKCPWCGKLVNLISDDTEINVHDNRLKGKETFTI